MIRLQIQHARTLAIVQRLRCATIVRCCATFDVIRCGRIDVMMEIRSCYYCFRIIVAADDVRLLRGTVLRYDFNVCLMAGSRRRIPIEYIFSVLIIVSAATAAAAADTGQMDTVIKGVR